MTLDRIPDKIEWSNYPVTYSDRLARETHLLAVIALAEMSFRQEAERVMGYERETPVDWEDIFWRVTGSRSAFPLLVREKKFNALSKLVRFVLSFGAPMNAEVAHSFIGTVTSEVSLEQVRNMMGFLYKEGEIDRVEKGVYVSGRDVYTASSAIFMQAIIAAKLMGDDAAYDSAYDRHGYYQDEA